LRRSCRRLDSADQCSIERDPPGGGHHGASAVRLHVDQASRRDGGRTSIRSSRLRDKSALHRGAGDARPRRIRSSRPRRVASAFPREWTAESMTTLPAVDRLFEAHLNVADLDRSIGFYRDRLGLELAHLVTARRAGFFWAGARGHSMLGLWQAGAGPQKTTSHIAFATAVDEV